MKASELRIGNYILLTNDNFYTSKVYESSGFDIYKLDESDCFDAKPIPITEEWLLKFGFELFYLDNPNQYGYQKKSIKLICDKSKGFNEIFVVDMPHIKYIHQLQNLYLAVNGQELIYDEWIVTKDDYPSISDILKD